MTRDQHDHRTPAQIEAANYKAQGRPPMHEQHPLSDRERAQVDQAQGKPGGPGRWFS